MRTMCEHDERFARIERLTSLDGEGQELVAEVLSAAAADLGELADRLQALLSVQQLPVNH